MAEKKETVGGAEPALRADGIYAFPEQLATSVRGQPRFSRTYVRLVRGTGSLTGPNWSMDAEEQVPILSGYINGALPVPSGLVAVTWTETGIVSGKIMRSAPTYVSSGKNLGRANATNIVQQAISEGRTIWKKKARKAGYTEDAAELEVVQSGHIKPMALAHFASQPEGEPFDITTKKAGCVTYKEGTQIFISPKADGDRLMAKVDANGQVDLWGRSGDVPPNPLVEIRDQLARLIGPVAEARGTSITFDGELYRHGFNHQFINAIYSNKAADASGLTYCVFDVLVGETEARPFTARRDEYNSLLSECRVFDASMEAKDVTSKYGGPWPNLARVPSCLVATSAEIQATYMKYLAQGFEGAVLRMPLGLYQGGVRKEVRSKDVIKLKPDYDAEFKIVGYKDGEGQDKGAITWILETVDSAGRTVTFSARPKMQIEERRALFAEMPTKFASDYLGRMMTIYYGDMTAAGIPRFPRAGLIRPSVNIID